MGKHHLLIGTWTPPGAIFTVEFDDEALTLELIKETPIPEDEPISWLTISHDKKALYGASMKKWSSHTISSPTNISHASSHPIGGDPAASRSNTNTRAIFCLAAKKPTYLVYGAPFYNHAGHGNVFSVDSSGKLVENVQNFAYKPNSGVHGMDFDPTEEYLYAADMHANMIWTHFKDPKTGLLELRCETAAPAVGDQPRWISVHQDGQYAYVVMEKGNRLAEYSIDKETRRPIFTGRTFPLSPPDVVAPEGTHFRGDVCFPSSSGKYLFASTRQSKAGIPGYLSTYRLKESGEIDEQLAIIETCTSGGHSNAVAPCPWSDEWLAVTDDEIGGIEIWKWRDEKLERVVRLEGTGHKGFGMNAVWYD